MRNENDAKKPELNHLNTSPNTQSICLVGFDQPPKEKVCDCDNFCGEKTDVNHLSKSGISQLKTQWKTMQEVCHLVWLSMSFQEKNTYFTKQVPVGVNLKYRGILAARSSGGLLIYRTHKK